MRPAKIDIHTHILPERWPDLVEKYGYPGFIHLDHHKPCCARMMIGDRFFREIDDRCWSPGRRIEDCDRDGVSVQVLSTVPVMFSYWAKPEHGLDLARMLNDHIAGVVREDATRFAGFGTLPMQDPELACRELDRCVNELGLVGVEIGTHIEPNEFTGRREVWNLNAPELFPIFERADEIGAAVFVHPWDMMGKERMTDYWLPWLVGMPAETSLGICSMIFGGVFERLPNLRVCFAHGGGSFPFTIGRVEQGFNCSPDLVAVDNAVNPRGYLAQRDEAGQLVAPARFWVDSLTHDADALRLLIQLFGAERIALGSDYPFPLGEAAPGKLIESMGDLASDVKTRLLSQAALQFLGISAS